MALFGFSFGTVLLSSPASRGLGEFAYQGMCCPTGYKNYFLPLDSKHIRPVSNVVLLPCRTQLIKLN